MKWDMSEPVRADKHFPWYLPSINEIFSSAISKSALEHRGKEAPNSLPVPGQLNFLLKDSFFYYPRCMYSAGMAEHDLEKSKKVDASVRSRDPLNTFILADSGGYQVITGRLDIDWDDPDNRLEKNLRWQEDMVTVGMYLEIPIHVHKTEYFEKADKKGEYKNKKGEPVSRIPNRFFNDKAQVLAKTEKSFEYFQENKSGKIDFLLPLHGGNAGEAIEWYEQFKRFDHIGYAVGGILAKDYTELISLIDYINRDGGFKDDKGQYFHVFGRGTATPAIAFTVLQAVMNKHCNDRLRVTFDASSPVSQGGTGKVYNDFQLLPDKYIASHDMKSFYERCKKLDEDEPYPYCESAVLEQMPIKDIFYSGGRSNYNMDALAYAIISSHNVFVHVRGLYNSLQRVMVDHRLLVEMLGKSDGSEVLKPYVSWDRVKKLEDAAAFYYSMLACSDALLAEPEHYLARLAADGYREGLFKGAMS